MQIVVDNTLLQQFAESVGFDDPRYATITLQKLTDIDDPIVRKVIQYVLNRRQEQVDERYKAEAVRIAKQAKVTPSQRNVLEKIFTDKDWHYPNNAAMTRAFNEIQKYKWAEIEREPNGDLHWNLTPAGIAALETSREHSPDVPKNVLTIEDSHRNDLGELYRVAYKFHESFNPLVDYVYAHSIRRSKANMLVNRGLLEKKGNYQYRFTQAGLREIGISSDAITR
jgi:hypothetical protein